MFLVDLIIPPFLLLGNHGTYFSIPKWLEAGLCGLLSSATLVIGAFLGYFRKISKREGVMAFGNGILIGAFSLDLMTNAYERGGLRSSIFGFICGAVLFILSN